MQNTSDVITTEFERGKIHHDIQMCVSCQNCVSICPREIWKVSDDEDRRTYVDPLRANECAFDMECVKNCSTGAIEIIPNKK